MFRKLKSLFGGGTTVDTVVHTPVAEPGGVLEGVVDVVGGEFEQQIGYVALSLETFAEVETEDSEHRTTRSFGEFRVSGPFTLHPGERLALPFGMPLPWQTPFNCVPGRGFDRVHLGVRTALEIARSLDKGDFDGIRVGPTAAQERIVTAFERIGCYLKDSDVEYGRVPGAEFPFVQELEFAPPGEFAGRLQEVEVVLLAGPHATDVLVEGDRRGGFFDAGGDRTQRFTVVHTDLDRVDWEHVVREQLHDLGRRRGLFG